MDTTASSEQIAEVIDTVVENTRSSVGQIGNVDGYIYEGNDGVFVVAHMTRYEAFLAECELFGHDVAEYNARVIKGMDGKAGER